MIARWRHAARAVDRRRASGGGVTVHYNRDGTPPFDTGWEADGRRHSPRGPRPRPDHERGLLGWWYRLTMPPAPPASASFAARERYRRARMASVILFVFALIVL